jgi:hypothetical protein
MVAVGIAATLAASKSALGRSKEVSWESCAGEEVDWGFRGLELEVRGEWSGWWRWLKVCIQILLNLNVSYVLHWSRAVVNSSYFLSSTMDFTSLSHRENDS